MERLVLALIAVATLSGSGCYLSHGSDADADPDATAESDQQLHYFQCAWGSGIYMVLLMCPDGTSLIRRGMLGDFTDPSLEVEEPTRSTWTQTTSPSGVYRTVDGEDVALALQDDGTWMVGPDRPCEGVSGVRFSVDEDDPRLPLPGGEESTAFGAWPGIARGLSCP